jgi:DNA (cytosine-5)-methyltransferase 1
VIGSLFSGIGGLELGLQSLGLGPVAWHCDADPAARRVLAEHWPEARCFEDVRDIDATADRVDIITGGFPCQPVSVAGKRKAQRDTRWLWPHFAAVVDVLRPRLVFIENVPGLRTAGLRDVLVDLAALGFDATWDCFSAEEVGAPHRRRRLFVLAYSSRKFIREQPRRRRGTRRAGAAHVVGDGTAGPVADTDSQGLEGPGSLPEERGIAAAGLRRSRVGAALADASRLSGDVLEKARSRDVPPAGRSPWAAEPDVGRVAHGVPARVDRLRLLGNACVPQQAALAFQALVERVVA